jgi:3-phenylpropionate/cinnamic acid dioxygenase small subunit
VARQHDEERIVSQVETTRSPVLPHTELYGRVLEFFNREAELLDTYKFDDWLKLFTDDIEYRMPNRTTRFLTDGDGFEEFELMSENRASLTTRVRRLETEFAWAEVPPSRTRHFVSNVIVEADGDAVLETRISFLITRTRQDLDYQMFTGQRVDRLVLDGDGFKIARRTILVDQTVITATNLSVLF